MIPFEIYFTSAAYAIVLGLLLTAVSRPLLGVLQQEGYAGSAFMKWYYRRNNEMHKRYLLLALCSALLSALLALCFSFAGTGVSTLLGHLGFAGMGALFLVAFRSALKVPLKTTPRAIRLAVATEVLLFAGLYGLSLGMYALAACIGHPLAYTLLVPVPLALVPAVLPHVLAAANAVMLVYELPHSNKFIRIATEKLAKSGCIKVGITGSYAKTSVKHFLKQILDEKYRVIATPASYNTPIGIAKCVNEGGLDCEIFLAEMGARKRGDIAELCDMVCPSFAIVTGICPQHLETFGSLEAVKAEKGVLAARAETVVLGETAASLERAGALVEGRDFGAENVVLASDGTSFDLAVGGERVAVTCNLLGRHAAEDVALAAALAFLLGMTPEEIAARVPALTPVPHRLERIDANGLVILDDSYNSNVQGARDAVETLKLFGGKKYVVTPGLVELGELEARENANLGAQFVGLDGVILVGETLVLSVRQGYLDAGGDDKALRIVPTLEKAQELLANELAAGDCVLFLNDLPDKYL